MTDLFQLLEFGPNGWGDELAAGAWLTVKLAVSTLPFGLAIGFLIALARDSNSRVLRIAGNTFTTIFRGLPELLTLFIIYYGGQILLQKLVGLFSDTYVEVSSFVAGMVALGLVLAAFSSEVFLAALRAVSKGQIETGLALGLTNFQTLRLITFPQLWRYAVPGISNLWLVLLKETSLVSIIALNDLLRMTNIAVGATKEPFFFYLVACAIYLTFSIISSFGITWIERRAERGERRAA